MVAAALASAATVAACGTTTSTGSSGPTAGASSSSPGSSSPAVSSSTVSSSPASSSTASSSASASASASVAVPAGDHRIGGSSVGISIEVPASYAVIDTSSLTGIDSGLGKLGIQGVSATTLRQELEAFQKLHGVFALDSQSMTTNPNHFADNINAYCGSSGTSLTGSAVAPLLRQAVVTQYQQKTGAQDVTATDASLGGVPGVQVTYVLTYTNGSKAYGSQVIAAIKPQKACFVTLTLAQPGSAGQILSVAAASAQFP